MVEANAKYVPLKKQSKKSRRAAAAQQRTTVPFNTGTRIHKTDKHPSRARAKQLSRKITPE